MSSRVVHFEVTADKPERAVKFYGDVFGWKISQWGAQEYWMADTGTGDGIGGAIMPRSGKSGTVNTIGVESLDQAAKAIQKAGGKVTSERQAVPTGGYFCYCEDTEGNPFGIIQFDKNAK